MSHQQISERNSALAVLDDVYVACVFCRDAYVRATHAISDELLRAVFAQAREERARLADELQEAILDMEGALPQPPRSPVSFGAWVSDRDLVSWCDCADEILLDAYKEALAGDCPEHLSALLQAHSYFLRGARERSDAWQRILAGDSAPKRQRSLDILFVGHGTQNEARAALYEHGVRVGIAPGIGEAIYRTLWQAPLVVVMPNAERGAFREALAAAGISEAEMPRILSTQPSMSLREGIAAVTELLPRQLAPRGAARVLVVEDDPDLQSVLCGELSDEGFEVQSASDGIEALEKLDRRGRNVVLLDLMMPRLSGIGFLKEVARMVETPPPVVIYSAYVEPVARAYPNVCAVVRKTEGLDRVVEALRSSMRSLTAESGEESREEEQ